MDILILLSLVVSFLHTFSKKKTRFFKQKNAFLKLFERGKAWNQNFITGRTWSSAKLFILKNYTTVADRKDYVMLSISLKINTTTIVDTRTASSFQKKEEATLSNVFSSINTKNQSKLSNFAMKPLLRLPTSQRHLHFLLWKICYKLQLNLCTCSFSLWKEGFCLNWFWLFAFFIHCTSFC